MTKPQDDLEAVRIIVDTLKEFSPIEQERIIRWAKEKLGLGADIPIQTIPKSEQQPNIPPTLSISTNTLGLDIKTFVLSKAPKSGNQFAATVAYYYKFEAPANERKDSIVGSDLQEACRLAGRERLIDPGQTLRDALKSGLLDRAERGSYSINTVGENLVAMTLPVNAISSQPKKLRSKKKMNSKSDKAENGDASDIKSAEETKP
jgi:hypothetical protein